MNYYSRSLNNCLPNEWPLLEDHLNRVSKNASYFASKFDSSSIAFMCGLWHDFGKFSNKFQDYMKESNTAHVENEKAGKKRVDHSTAGAVLAFQQYGKSGDIIARIIASHHAGLPNKDDFRNRFWEDEQSRIFRDKALQLFKACLNEESQNLFQQKNEIKPPDFFGNWKFDKNDTEYKDRTKRLTELWIRFCFSCLIDADRLDAEFDGDPQAHQNREIQKSKYSTLNELREELKTYLEKKTKSSESRLKSDKQKKVHEARQKVLSRCEEAANQTNQKCFSLTVPTGGGKTLSSMKFALDHAFHKNKLLEENQKIERVIVVIPYTSIIEQNASVYREAFGELGSKNILEHHSNLDPDKENELNRLVTDNWDAPVIVTTSVQFFESLFANKPSKCRKLHNIANSIVVFDEVQTFPVNLLEPILEVLGDLKECFGVVPVFCTATQPAFSKEDLEDISDTNPLKKYAIDIHSIIPPEEQITLFTDLERVKFNDTSLWLKEKTDEELADLITKDKRVLMITDTKKSAQYIFNKVKELLPENERKTVFHLSTLMCPVHRKKVLKKVRRILKWTKNPCRVIATQLIEAGVDVDFEKVIRVLGGLDSIAQAAGRCNREGKMESLGEVEIYSAKDHKIPSFLSQARSITPLVIRNGFNNLPNDFKPYFKSLYSICQTGGEVNKHRSKWDFEDTANSFKMIEDNTISVIVLFDEKAQDIYKKYLEGIKSEPWKAIQSIKRTKKLLQRYTVNIYPSNEIRTKEDLQKFSINYDENLGLILDSGKDYFQRLYDEDTGLNPEKIKELPNLEIQIA